jgi:hypothetical protein
VSLDRATLHESKFAAFVSFAEGLGYVSEATKGTYEVIRLRKGDQPPLIFHQRNRTRHATISSGEAMRLVRQFIRERGH